MDNIKNDWANGTPSLRSWRSEYIFCGSCDGVHYTIAEAQDCSCGAGKPCDNDGNPYRRVIRPRKVR